MTGMRRFLFFCCVILALPCPGASAAASPSDYASRMNTLPAEIVAKMRGAVHGDASAAYDLWWFFSIDRNDPKEAHFWIKLSAEQGLCAAEFQYAYELVFIYEDLDQAAFWLRRFEAAPCPELPRRDERVTKLWERIASRTQRSQ